MVINPGAHYKAVNISYLGMTWLPGVSFTIYAGIWLSSASHLMSNIAGYLICLCKMAAIVNSVEYFCKKSLFVQKMKDDTY
jgi:hypothetical protein